jgi:hypothetical protein
MFRRGGNTNMNGIMSNVEDRQDYQIGGGAGIQAENIRVSDLPFMKNEMPSVNSSAPSITNNQDPSYAETVRKIMDEYESKRINPIYKLAIQGGLRGMSERRGGSVAANLAKAFEGPTDQLFKDLDAKRKLERDVELRIADVAEQKNRRLQEQGFELQKLLTKDMRNELRQQAINLAEGDPEGRSVDEILGILTQKKLQELSKFRKMADPRETARIEKNTKISELIASNKEIDGSSTFDIFTAPAYIEERSKLPEKTKIDESNKTIEPRSTTTDELGNLILKDKKDAVDYEPSFVYFEKNSKKFYRFNGTSFIPLATE